MRHASKKEAAPTICQDRQSTTAHRNGSPHLLKLGPEPDNLAARHTRRLAWHVMESGIQITEEWHTPGRGCEGGRGWASCCIQAHRVPDELEL
jgi:hypothetical protein